MSTSTDARRVLLAVEDAGVQRRFRELLDATALQVEVQDPGQDPLERPPQTAADLLVVRRQDLRPRDLDLVRAFTDRESGPALVVLTEDAADGDRARLMAAGASGVLEGSDSNRDLRSAIERIAEAEANGGPGNPGPGTDEHGPRLSDFHSRAPRMRGFLDLVERVVETDSSLLITGATGVGKDHLAQAIHNEGARREGPFITVNCGALPEHLLESELFGHEVGAFTGAARRKRGRFELAEGGTIFLDEIAEMPVHLQVNLLTVLQRRRVQRLGSEETVPIDVRVMAATNRDVHQEVKEGRFREDLYYRLSVVMLEIPSLHERREDIPDLVGTFIHHFRHSVGRDSVEGISDDALELMMQYRWPGNLRELVNAVEHAMVLCRTAQITPADLPDTLLLNGADAHLPGGSSHHIADSQNQRAEWLNLPLRDARNQVSRDFERHYLDQLLARTQGKVGETAELAGITPRSLYEKMKRHGLRKEDYR